MNTFESQTMMSPFSNLLSSRTDLVHETAGYLQRETDPFHTVMKEAADGVVRIPVLWTVAVV